MALFAANGVNRQSLLKGQLTNPLQNQGYGEDYSATPLEADMKVGDSGPTRKCLFPNDLHLN